MDTFFLLLSIEEDLFYSSVSFMLSEPTFSVMFTWCENTDFKMF